MTNYYFFSGKVKDDLVSGVIRSELQPDATFGMLSDQLLTQFCAALKTDLFIEKFEIINYKEQP